MGLIELDLEGHLGLKTDQFSKFCLYDNSSRIWPRLESPSLYRICILRPFRTLLKTFYLQGHIGINESIYCKCQLVCTITCQGIKARTSIISQTLLNLKMGSIDLDLQSHFGNAKRYWQMFNFPYLRNGLIDWHQTQNILIDEYQ